MLSFISFGKFSDVISSDVSYVSVSVIVFFLVLKFGYILVKRSCVQSAVKPIFWVFHLLLRFHFRNFYLISFTDFTVEIIHIVFYFFEYISHSYFKLCLLTRILGSSVGPFLLVVFTLSFIWSCFMAYLFIFVQMSNIEYQKL